MGSSECKFHLYSREKWSKNLIDFTLYKMIKMMCDSDKKTKKLWKDTIEKYKAGKIVAGWDKGQFVYHPVVKESR